MLDIIWAGFAEANGLLVVLREIETFYTIRWYTVRVRVLHIWGNDEIIVDLYITVTVCFRTQISDLLCKFCSLVC